MKLVWICLVSLGFIGNDLFSQHIDFSAEDRAWADKKLSKMNLKEKIGQLFMMDISPRIENSKKKKEMLDMIKKYRIGGLIIMKGDYSITSEWIRDFQNASSTPLMVSIDGEWGINMRIASTTKFPYQLTLGALTDDQQIYKMGAAIAKDCKRLGIHVNFAPVVDVNVNPKNPVINFRSFGENKLKVTNKGLQYALGMQDNGVLACLKHFPGHGDTDMDSHKDLPVITKSREEVFNLELYPFDKLVKQSIWGVMVGHLKVPELDAMGVPSSLSKPMITDILKNQFGFEGLVFSDALNMKGVSAYTSPGKMELDAYLAGNDILLYSENIEKGMNAIESYLKSNKEAKAELDKRVHKILLFKHKLNAHIMPEVNYSPQESENLALSETIFENALTLLSDDQIPLENWMDPNKKTLFISLSNENTELRKLLEKSTNFTFFNIQESATLENYNTAIRSMREFDQVIVSYHDLSQYEKNGFGINQLQTDFIQNTATKDQVLHLWFGNPYALKYFQSAGNVLVAYEDNLITQSALFNLMRQKKPAQGKLPVSIGKYKEGQGYEPAALLKSSIPTQAMDESTLDKATILMRIESLSNEIVYSGVAPGFQMVVFHKGREIFNKCYGRHSYSESSPIVKSTDIYDLASLTKILSTTLCTMKLVDEGDIDLQKTVLDYIDLDDSATIRNISIHQLLTHEGGLTPYIPFYQRFNVENYFNYFDTKKSSYFPSQVADNMYVRYDYKDSMWHEMSHSELKNIGKYKYSDLSMYIMQKILEETMGQSLDVYVTKNFYKKMGVGLTYNPHRKYPLSRIIPTEYDEKFRLQQVHGYVHDQGCSLYGGVSGHAGLFGNATDVAKVMQMLLNGGKLNGTKFLEASTISQFTSQQRLGSRRGLGFDKPDLEDPGNSPTARECSFASYGHTGFTGTCTWVDPFKELVFVFLSNRVCPSAENKKLAKGNYRERMMSLFYQYINSQ